MTGQERLIYSLRARIVPRSYNLPLQPLAVILILYIHQEGHNSRHLTYDKSRYEAILADELCNNMNITVDELRIF